MRPELVEQGPQRAPRGGRRCGTAAPAWSAPARAAPDGPRPGAPAFRLALTGTVVGTPAARADLIRA